MTKVKLAQKQREGIAEARSGRRSPVSDRTCRIIHLPRIFSVGKRSTNRACVLTVVLMFPPSHTLLVKPKSGRCSTASELYRRVFACQYYLNGKQAS